MDISKVREVIKRFNFLRDYSSLAAPLIITLVSVVMLVVSPVINGKLKDRIERESVGGAKKISSLNKQGSVLSTEQWKIEEAYQLEHEHDANEASHLVVECTKRELLSYKIFPAPKDLSSLIFKDFGNRYRKGIEGLIERINGRDCPSDVEIERHLNRSVSSRTSSLSPTYSSISSGRLSTNSLSRIGSSRGSYGSLNDVDARIVDALCLEKAEEALVYVDPEDISGYRFWEDYVYVGPKESVEDCWYWQLAYWIIEDVSDTVLSVNKGSNNIFSSPVKRLVGISFGKIGRIGSSSTGRRNVVSKDQSQRPQYVMTPEDATASYTGRFCDEKLDIVHFKLSFLVAARDASLFIKELCKSKKHKFSGYFGEEEEQIFRHNQITVLESYFMAIDRADASHVLYRYGEDSVVELILVCEYIFNKEGYDKIKPESIKELLNGSAGADRGGLIRGRK